MEIELGGGAVLACIVASVMLGMAAILTNVESNRYVDCRKVCAPAAVKIQDGRHGRCECHKQGTN